jgi:hypothetical protein
MKHPKPEGNGPDDRSRQRLDGATPQAVDQQREMQGARKGLRLERAVRIGAWAAGANALLQADSHDFRHAFSRTAALALSGLDGS